MSETIATFGISMMHSNDKAFSWATFVQEKHETLHLPLP